MSIVNYNKITELRNQIVIERFRGVCRGLALDVLKFVFLHGFFPNQESFSRKIKFNINRA